MKVLLQRVSQATVMINGVTYSEIGPGLLLLVGIEKHDTLTLVEHMCTKILAYRLFSDDAGKMNLSVQDIQGEILAVSQFTLAADTQKGLRPGFSAAAKPDEARILYEQFVCLLKQSSLHVATGKFGADMQVSLTNDGPVTFMLTLAH